MATMVKKPKRHYSKAVANLALEYIGRVEEELDDYLLEEEPRATDAAREQILSELVESVPDDKKREALVAEFMDLIETIEFTTHAVADRGVIKAIYRSA